MSEEGVAYASPAGRGVLAATVLGSGMVFLDSTVANVALRPIGKALDADLAVLQWVVNGYTLALAALILLGGSLGDRFGRRRVFVVGTVWFAVGSLLCGLAPTGAVLVAARVLQGVGGALLTPGSLAILQTSLRHEDRARAIGAWSGLAGLSSAAGPLVGGWLVSALSWRWAFLLNLPLAVVVVTIALRCVPESRSTAVPRLDPLGALLAALALGGSTYALVSWGSPAAWAALVVGVASAVAFLGWQRVALAPMLPLGIFRSRAFSAANVATFVVYGGLAGVTFLLVLDLQVASGFSPLVSGSLLLPITAMMLLLSSHSGALATRTGARLPMTVGPVIVAVSVLVLATLPEGGLSWLVALVGAALLGLGMAVLVAPLTATVLASVGDEHAGLASGVNNAVARTASLVAVAALPVVVGLGGDDYADPRVLHPAYRTAMLLCAGLVALGAVVSWVGVPGRADAEG
ncbi:EmrB/QacA subfamily drug resistance transporter [Motilibacter rhizosphaerae]|uniref:EmrB/QacA subfamily drug resistance transporter n=1 Tax=Motilibacter rhizosphaerae TaxID=598652 RepID=A0A4Q7NUV4_9ACTN|nr:MFS transporter [Motilibacter rhizosphaerae]RZS90915.1 EmrB/QacA subfamily drug resistance transporter [Motilibacter rhizosphaerae]